MKAIVQTGYGGNEVLALRDVPKPQCGRGQVLIEVAGCGLNPLDFKLRNGLLRPVQRLEFPHIAGNEVSGTIAELGPGATRFEVGDRVYARLNKRRMGGLAEWVAEDEAVVARAPENLSLEAAAGVPLRALTAYQALIERGGLRRDQRVLIHAGAGAVGRIAIQLAKRAGALVATTVSPRGIEVVRRLGADQVIDYRARRFEDCVANMDLVLDTVGGETLNRSLRVLSRGGRLLSIAGMPEPRSAADMEAGFATRALFWLVSARTRAAARRHGVDYRYLFMRPDGGQLGRLTELIEAGELEIDLDRTFAMDDFAAAFDYLEQGRSFGKVVVRIKPPVKQT